MPTRHHRLLAGAALLALTTACHAPADLIRTRPFAPSFRMQVDGAAATSPEGRAAVGAPARHAGELTVRFAHMLGDRRLMATVADVRSLTIHLSGNGVDHTETVGAAQIANGMTSFTFTGLPAGTLTVTIRALDAAGAVIGADVRQATITAGQTTVVASTVMIVPAVAQPRIIVAPTSGGSGGAGGATGSLTTTVTLTDGAPVVTPALLGVYTNDVQPHAARVAVDAQGSAWFVGGNWANGAATPARLKRVTAAGAVTTIDTDGHSPYDVATSADGGQVFFSPWGVDSGRSSSFGFAADGTALAPWPVDDLGSGGPIAVAPDGTYLMAVDQTLMGYRDGLPSGFLAEFPIFTPWAGVRNLDSTVAVLAGAAASDGDFTVAYSLRRNDTSPHVAVIRYNQDGTWAYAFDVPVSTSKYAGFDLDAQDHAWVASPDRKELLEVSPTGALLGTYPLPARFNAVHVDAAGRIWAYQAQPTSAYPVNLGGDSGAPDDLVMRVGTDGKVQAYYHLGLGVDVYDLEVSADGHMWVASGSKGLLHLQLP